MSPPATPCWSPLLHQHPVVDLEATPVFSLPCFCGCGWRAQPCKRVPGGALDGAERGCALQVLCLSALLCQHLNPHLQLPPGAGNSPPDLFTCQEISINYPHAFPSCRKLLGCTNLKHSVHGGFGTSHILVPSSTSQHPLGWVIALL